MTVAAFLFALMNGAIRLLGDGWGADGGEGMHPFQIAFLRNLFALAFMLPWLLRHRRGGLATGRLGTHLWRAGIGLIAMLTWFSAIAYLPLAEAVALNRSEEHTSELQSLMRISYAVFCLKKKKNNTTIIYTQLNK